MASVIVLLMCEQGVASDVFVGPQTSDAPIHQPEVDLPPSGAAVIRGQAESRLLCFLPVPQAFGAPQ